jgi:hypothetical protein
MAGEEAAPAIRRLDEAVVNKIAAGEIIQCPASVLKVWSTCMRTSLLLPLMPCPAGPAGAVGEQPGCGGYTETHFCAQGAGQAAAEPRQGPAEQETAIESIG